MHLQPSNKLFKTGLKIVRLIAKKDHLAFFVGGVVRDMLLKRESNNIDIATDATPDQTEKILIAGGFEPKPLGKKFGTILTIVDKTPVEITTFRSEGRYSDNRHPDQVRFIKEYLDDAKRRDFTINALYYDPIKKQLYDPTKGIKDLRLMLIRFVGDPKKRIDEDALRMLRGVRLATQLGFKLEKNTFAAIKTRAKYIQGISGERIKMELDKILLSTRRGEGIRLLDATGLLKFILPELVTLKNVSHKSKLFHLEGNVFAHTILVIEALATDNLDLLYAGLFHDLGKVIKPLKVYRQGEWRNSFRGHDRVSVDIFKKFSSKYRFSKHSRDNVLWLIEHHDDWRNFMEMKPRTKLRFVSNKNFSLLVELTKADDAGNIRNNNKDEVKQKRKALYLESEKLLKQVRSTAKLQSELANGDVIMKHSGLKPGRELGQKIEDVKTEIILGRIKNKVDLKKYFIRRKNT